MLQVRTLVNTWRGYSHLNSQDRPTHPTYPPQAFGAFFKKAAPFFKMYSSYVSNYDRAMESLVHLIEVYMLRNAWVFQMH